MTLVWIMCAAHFAAAPDSGPFRETLTSAERNIHLAIWQVSSRELDPKSPVPWSVRKSTLHGGKQEGVDVVVIDNGKLAITVIPTRGMGILKVEMGDVRLGWDSPIKEVVNPAYVNLQARGGLGWLEAFNEWMIRCGLESAGQPGKDKFITNTGDEAEMDLTVHGKIANIPASEVEVVIDREAPHRIHVRGRVDERTFFGPKLELWTELSTEPGSGALRLEDTLTNRGTQDQEFQLIYHTNFGAPVLGEGARLVAPIMQVTPFNARAAQGIDHFADYAGPKAGFIEQVYCMQLHGDAQNRTMVLLKNGAGDRGSTMAFSLAELPFFTQWKNTTAVEDGYVTGLEPATGFPNKRVVERKFGRVPKLKQGESRKFRIDFGVLAGKDEVDRAVGEISRIQAGRETRVEREPVPIQ
jgi:uncharacterized protein DUF4432